MRSWRKSEVGPISRAYAWLVVTLRWFVVLAWAGLAAGAALWLPGTTPGGDLGGFAPPNSRAIATESESARAYGFPVLSRTVLVRRDANGLSDAAQRRVVERAVAMAQQNAGNLGPIAGVVPIGNTEGVFPSSSERGTTALTYVFTKPGTSFGQELRAAEEFGRTHVGEPDDQ